MFTVRGNTDPVIAADLGIAVGRVLLGARDDLLDVVTGIATRRSAEDEFARSLRAVAGLSWELRRYRRQRISKVSTFLPSNNVLYSYTLFGIIPASYCDRVAVRPSTRVSDTALALHDCLVSGLQNAGLNIEMKPVPQRRFLEDCSGSHAVVFSGRPENGAQLAANLGSRTRILTFGSGPNPIVVGPAADLEVACQDVIEARMYNSGQDCLCPDVVFVHSSVVAEFQDRLAAALDAVTVGDRWHPETTVAPLVYPDAFDGAARFLAEFQDAIVRGGYVDARIRLVEPALLRLAWDPEFRPPELFSPIVVLMEYDNSAKIESWLCADAELTRGMYVSIYGEPALEARRCIGTSVVCVQQTTFDVEDGNRPFGGYGAEANVVYRDGAASARPLLLSAEVYR